MSNGKKVSAVDLNISESELLGGVIDDVDAGVDPTSRTAVVVDEVMQHFSGHVATLARWRGVGKTEKLSVSEIDEAESLEGLKCIEPERRPGLIAVADQARRGLAYARAAVLAEHFAELASSIALHPPENDRDVAYVDAAWSTYMQERFGLAVSVTERRDEVMSLLDELVEGDEDSVELLELLRADVRGATDEDFLALVEAWRRTGGGNTGKSKYKVLLEFFLAHEPELAGVSWRSLENQHTALKKRRASKESP